MALLLGVLCFAMAGLVSWPGVLRPRWWALLAAFFVADGIAIIYLAP